MKTVPEVPMCLRAKSFYKVILDIYTIQFVFIRIYVLCVVNFDVVIMQDSFIPTHACARNKEGWWNWIRTYGNGNRKRKAKAAITKLKP